MRPGQNKRMRGRNTNGGGSGNGSGNRKGPNPLTRSYESNGPDVKIRGTAHHVAEKYLQLARDAQSSGDPVMAESYLQHAEHYFRLIATAQAAQQQAAYGYNRSPGEAVGDDEEEDDDFGGLPDRFASPAERVAPPPPPVPQYADRPYNNGGERPYESRGERFQQDRSHQDRPHQDRPNQDRANQDRTNQDKPFGGQASGDRYDNRSERRDRQPYGERLARNGERGADRNTADRNGSDRVAPDRSVPDRSVPDRSVPDRSVPDRAAPEPSLADRAASGRDYDNRSPRPRREFRNEPGAPREPRQADAPVSALPAFITAPARVQPEPSPAVDDVAPPVAGASAEASGAPDTTGAEDFPTRPRRRRRAKADLFAPDGETQQEAPADPVGE